eukprot:TRINITY_DN86436_c0_g1_i1.p1 TRINITY_DN86436_c0_g1~~TRINITY_DN86436_c0_g1_i1.p1  ORF type:complete len:177 (+),score=51.45 TRINITY_DN86436_c0_g1_i1:47-532(+)
MSSKETRTRGLKASLEEAKRIDSKGLSIIEEIAEFMQRRDGPGVSDEEQHSIAAEELEPRFELLQEVLEQTVAAATSLHQMCATNPQDPQGHIVETKPEEALHRLMVADFVEQDAQFKAELIESLTHASNAEQATAIRVIWSSRPWLEHDELQQILRDKID